MLSNNITQDNKIGLILTANIVIIDLAKKADVILITPNIVSQTHIYSISAIHIVFYNKARKASKLGSLTRFA
jgi:hypothetical protein